MTEQQAMVTLSRIPTGERFRDSEGAFYIVLEQKAQQGISHVMAESLTSDGLTSGSVVSMPDNTLVYPLDWWYVQPGRPTR